MIKSLLKQNYTIPQLITKIHEDFGELFSEEEIYEYAYNGHIQLSLMIPKDFYFGHILEATDQITEDNKDYEYYSNQATNESSFAINSKLYLSFENQNYQISGIQESKSNTRDFPWEIPTDTSKNENSYQEIEDLWDIPTITHNGQRSDFLSTLHLFTPNSFGDLYSCIPKIDLISPQKDKYAIAYRAKYRNDLFDLTWSFDDDRPNEAKLVIRKENLDKFINMFKNNEEVTKQQTTTEKVINKNNEKLNPRKYNNLVALIGFLLKYPNEIPHRIDDHTIIIDKLLKSFQTKNYKIYEKEALTDVIKDALKLIQERDRSN